MMRSLTTLLVLLVGACANAHTLTLMNLSDRAIRGAPVVLDGIKVYRVLQLLVGTPLQITDNNERRIPCMFDTNRRTITVWVQLGVAERAVFNIRAASHWPTIEGATAEWDEQSHRGELRSPWLRVTADESGITVALPDGKTVLTGLSFYGWLSDKPIRVPSPDWAASHHLPRLSTVVYESLQGQSESPAPVSAALRLVKHARAPARGIVYNEAIVLRADQPVLEYRLRIENRRNRTVYIADCDGIIHGVWGGAIADEKRLLLPTEVAREINDSWQAVREGQIPVGERTWMVVKSKGISVGLVGLSAHTHCWAFTNAGFWIYQAGSRGERPIAIPPGGSVSFGLAFAVFPPGASVFDETRAVFAALARRRGVSAAQPPISAFVDHHAACAAPVGCFRTDFRTTHQWLITGGAFSPPGQLVCNADVVTAKCAFNIVHDPPLFMDMEVSKVAGALHIVLESLDGRRRARFQVAKSDRYRWQLDFSGPVTLSLSLHGKGHAAMIKSLYCGPRPLRAPILVSPMRDAHLTDVAAFFAWKPVRGADRYEVALSQRRDFRDAVQQSVPALKANLAVCFPKDPLPVGTWLWRVRALGADGCTGEWSETRSLTIDASHPKTPLVRPISPDMPLFVFHSPSEIDRAWRAIPDDLKRYCALRLEVSERRLNLAHLCKTAESTGANLVVQCSGPGGGVYGEVYSGGRYGRESLADLEWAFQHCPHVIGATIVEQFFHHFTDPTSKEYAKRLIILCAKYGRLLIWADGHWVRRGWLRLGSDPEMMALFRQYKGYVAPLWKMNCGREPLTIHGAVLGLWLSGVVANFGVEPEDWYWFEAGYRHLGETSAEFKTGDRKLCPPTFWGQMMIMGLATGATCWCLEPSSAMWQQPDKMRDDTFTRVVAPLMRAIIRHRLIPSRDDVAGNIKAACVLDAEGASNGWTRGGEGRVRFGPFEQVFLATYGLRHAHELLPNSGRYYIIPILPPLFPSALQGVKVLSPSEFRSTAKAKPLFDALYPQFYEGDALVLKVGNLVIITNAHENTDAAQSFLLRLDHGGVRSVSGEIAVHGYIVAKVQDSNLLLHVNGRPEKLTSVTLETTGPAQIDASPAASVTVRRKGSRAVSLVVRHTLGACDIRVHVP